VFLILGAGIGACGGGDDDNGQSGGDPVAKANRICRNATSRAGSYARTHPSPKKASEVDVALQADSAIADDLAAKLGSIDASKGSDLARFVAAERESASLSPQEVAAAAARDPKRLVAAGERLLAVTGRAKTAAEGAGLSDCPSQPVSVFYARSSGGPPSQDTGDARGTWTGGLTQYGPGDTTSRYRVRMTIRALTSGAPAGTIAYPSLHCGGKLRLSRASGQRYVFRERITTGRKLCFDGGTIIATVAGDGMSWRWVGTTSEVLGRLKRR